MKIPSEQECLNLLDEAAAAAVKDHSIRVMKIALAVAKKLQARGIEVNLELVKAAALLHDILKLNSTFCHAKEGGDYLRKKGMSKVARLVESHAIGNIHDPLFRPGTIEEKIILYADLRANPGKIVSLDERFKYIMQTYSASDEEMKKYYKFAKKIEKELLGASTELDIKERGE